MRAYIQATILSAMLISCAHLTYAADSSSITPHIVVAQQATPSVDTNPAHCTNPSASATLNVGDASGSGAAITHNYNPGQCPTNYVMVSFSDNRSLTGIYNSGTYLVDRSVGSTITYTCCPMVSTWKAVQG